MSTCDDAVQQSPDETANVRNPHSAGAEAMATMDGWQRMPAALRYRHTFAYYALLTRAETDMDNLMLSTTASIVSRHTKKWSFMQSIILHLLAFHLLLLSCFWAD